MSLVVSFVKEAWKMTSVMKLSFCVNCPVERFLVKQVHWSKVLALELLDPSLCRLCPGDEFDDYFVRHVILLIALTAPLHVLGR